MKEQTEVVFVLIWKVLGEVRVAWMPVVGCVPVRNIVTGKIENIVVGKFVLG